MLIIFIYKCKAMWETESVTLYTYKYLSVGQQVH